MSRIRRILSGRAALSQIALAASILVIAHLIVEIFAWRFVAVSGSHRLAQREAELFVASDFYHFLRLAPNGNAYFSGDLEEGIEVWNHPYADGWFHYRPYRTAARAYVKSFNEHMAFLVNTLDTRPSSIKRRIEQLNHEERPRREEAARMLGMMEPEAAESVAALSARLTDESPDVRLMAARAIAAIGPTGHNEIAIAALEELAKVPNEQLRLAARKAIASLQMTGVEPTPSADEN